MGIDFNEIKSSDDWELFAREFFKSKGFNIIYDPARGADEGSDLIIEEHLQGLLSNNNKRWLVSCKHYITTNRSISCKIENNIVDRINRHNCNGFIGFYSTLASSDLQKCLNELKSNNSIEYCLYDNRKIEHEIIDSNMEKLLLRFFPNYYSEQIKPISKLSDSIICLECDYCGKNLLDINNNDSLILYYKDLSNSEVLTYIEDIRCVCKGRCDAETHKKYIRENLIDSCDELADYKNPYLFLDKQIEVIKQLNRGELKFSSKAFKKYCYINFALAQTIFRQLTNEEKEKVNYLINYYNL